MATIAAVFLVPITLLIVLLYGQIDADVSFYKQERLGVAYTRALRPLFADLEALRLASGRPVAARIARAHLDADFATASAIDRGAGEPLGLTADLDALADLRRAGAGPAPMLDALLSLLGSVSDNSKITLDPILDGYYVGDTMVNKIPSLIDSVAQATSVGARWLRTQHISPNERIRIAILAGQVEIARGGIEHNLPIAAAAAPYLHRRLDVLREREREQSSRYASWIKSNLLQPAQPHGSSADLLQREADAVTAGFTLYDASIDAMDDVLRRRIHALFDRELSIFAVIAVALTVAGIFMILAMRSMSRMLTDKTALEHEVLERTQAEAQLAYAAFHDDLTGLSNRAFLMDELERITAGDGSGRMWAILFLDLDRFKVINDSLGHITGDLVLVEAARRLERFLRSGDTLTRLGGDEFVILLDEVDDLASVCDVARRVLRAFEAPIFVSGREVFATASIGIAMSDDGSDTPEDVLRNADIAMYRAKELGKQRFEVFTPDLLKDAVSRLDVETDLARALEREEFRLFYQPVVSLADGRLAGFEALVRWDHPKRGIVSPDQFIPVAEENGSIVAIGEWIMHEACRQLTEWRAAFPQARQLRMNVNVSAKQLRAPGFTRSVADTLAACGLDPDAVNVEITETVLVDDAEHARKTLNELRELGLHIHLDDFGTGYSSLAYLRDFPIDALKIDRSFVGYPNTRADAGLLSVEIVRTILALAESLGLHVTAEGIETRHQLEQLSALGCTNGQGFYFSRPVPASGATEMIGRPAHALPYVPVTPVPA